MAHNPSFVRVPPDGAGKKLYTQEHIVGPDQVHGQVMHVADSHNPEHIWNIDAYGAGRMAFSEGAPGLDAFGNLRVSDAHILGGYEHTQDAMDDLFFTEELVGGLATHVPAAAAMRLSVTADAGSTVRRTTNRYHYYQPGVGNLIIITLQHGDAGKVNNIRKWGYFDEDNGLYWELRGTELHVVIRSSTTGSVVDTDITQAAWNGDRLDGTGLSGMTIDLTRANFFWIDFAWLGVGTVRFGVLAPDGTRVVCHTFQNPNANVNAYMGQASLPIRLENYNELGTAGSSEMNFICGAIYAESKTDYTFWRFADLDVENKTITANTPVLGARATLLLDTGQTNRVTAYPETLSVFVAGGDAKITLWYDPVLTGATWLLGGGATLEGDAAATSQIPGATGYAAMTWYVSPGSHNIDLRPFFETNDEGIALSADGVTQPTAVFAGTALTVTATTVSASLTYRELR